MAKRLKQEKKYGIRPHVFHMWADKLIEAVDMQHARVLAHGFRVEGLSEAELTAAVEFTTRRARIDLDFYFTALRRLLRIAEVAIPEGYGGRALKAALKDFKAAVPGLIEVRDSAEHPDFVATTGQVRSEVIGLGGGLDASFWHGNDQFHLNKTTAAARALYQAIKHQVPPGAPDAIVAPLLRGESERAIREATWTPAKPPTATTDEAAGRL